MEETHDVRMIKTSQDLHLTPDCLLISLHLLFGDHFECNVHLDATGASRMFGRSVRCSRCTSTPPESRRTSMRPATRRRKGEHGGLGTAGLGDVFLARTGSVFRNLRLRCRNIPCCSLVSVPVGRESRAYTSVCGAKRRRSSSGTDGGRQ